MEKICFTNVHEARLKELAVEMLFENHCIYTKLGQLLTVDQLLHTTTINTLNEIKKLIKKKIEALEESDEWAAPNQKILESLKRDCELVNLIIGYKRNELQKQEIAEMKESLSKQLLDLKESQKTPEDKIKELEAKLAELDK